MDDATNEMLARQFTQNTGRSILDSGDAYGRGWQRKAGMTVEDFTSKPKAYVQDDYLLLNTHQWLAERLCYHAELDALYEKFARQPKRQHDADLQIAEEFAEKLEEHLGDGMGEVRSCNTYNYDNMLDEVIQYVTVSTYEYGTVVILQTHNGCDVRGGYSTPHVYTIDDEYELFDEGISVQCPGPEPIKIDAEPLEGTPEPEDQAHYLDKRNTEWIDEEGMFVAVDEEFPFTIDDGEVICKKHWLECDVYAQGE